MRDYLGRTFGNRARREPIRTRARLARPLGEQFDIWQAVYGPVGDDGYPKQIFNKETGDIDRSRRRLLEGALRPQRHHAARLGDARPQTARQTAHLRGSADTYFLTDAVYYLEDFLKVHKESTLRRRSKYGDRAEHCWNGDPNLPNYLSRLHYNTMYLPKILARIQKTAPPGCRSEVVALLVL